MTRVGIIDYGAGNLFSLKTGLERRGVAVEITDRFSKQMSFDGVILPGVGNFGAAAKTLKPSKEELISAVKSGLPFLGICLGAQLIFKRSEEDKGEGLAFLDGDVVRLPNSVKVPHMGWNNLDIAKRGELLKNVEDKAWVYFVHSYYPKTADDAAVAATSDYGVKFPAVIAKKNIFGTQFHPEKSGPVGAVILNNFIEICRR
ncbi:MAG: imidazole glycerol phosphate synthase subunit HisH [Thaumarchaeota archaeon]|nr:imidazole glycerol phosphate synthase subunit HisH [Nitrososphaerota archaeon]MCL5317818.1 imidazole glycerol phosphate synthase subunit HisH [Nitrososphaerota archaeon]